MFKRISLGYRPKGCRNVKIIGVKANLSDYSRQDRKLIESSDTILYPTRLYARQLTDAGKKVFPSARDYYYAGDKIKQTILFDLVGLPTPRTKVFYGRKADEAEAWFGYPFVAKIPRGVGEGRGVFLIRSKEEFRECRARSRVAYIQEYLPLDRDLRVVVTAGRLVSAYWRIIPDGGFLANVRQGGRIDLNYIPEEGVRFAVKAAGICGFDDVGMDVCFHNGRWLLLEANMRYGALGLKKAGIKMNEILDRLIEEGAI